MFPALGFAAFQWSSAVLAKTQFRKDHAEVAAHGDGLTFSNIDVLD